MITKSRCLFNAFGVTIFSLVTIFNINFAFKTAHSQNVTLKVGLSPDFPPFESENENGIVGIDIDILNEISRRTGIIFKPISMSFGSILGSLQTGKIDIGMSGISVTTKRKKSVDFSENYHKSNLVFLAKKELLSINSIKNTKVGTQSGSTMEKFLNKNKKKYNIKIISIDSNTIGLKMLEAGKIDSFLTEDVQASEIRKNYHDLKAMQIEGQGANYAMAFPKNSKYISTINNVIQNMKQDGTIDKIKANWIANVDANNLHKVEEQENIKTNNKYHNHINTQYLKSLLWIIAGVSVTLPLVLISVIFGSALAICITVFRYNGIRFLRSLANVYVSIIRGTPLLLQFSVLYFIVPHILNINLSIFTSAVIALSVNSASYVAEIIRGGLNAMDATQLEAADSMNLSKWQKLKDIIIPQVLHNIAPAMMNEIISLVKESSVISIFGGYDIIKRANLVSSQYYSYFTPLFIAGLTYYVIIICLERLLKFYENKKKY